MTTTFPKFASDISNSIVAINAVNSDVKSENISAFLDHVTHAVRNLSQKDEIASAHGAHLGASIKDSVFSNKSVTVSGMQKIDPTHSVAPDAAGITSSTKGRTIP